ncbi:ATP-binding protein [Sneathiella aquimaris]|uniref:ATP-binding protein n=1 Tax=Sneathiella aquimaris TaxID=2599305 RepID=UPI00146DE4F3|nr:ATP-binding protein [Sneathiella aquimaris]
MDGFLEALARGYVALIANLGLLAMLAWCVSLFGAALFSDKPRLNGWISFRLGLVFGLAAALLINLPIEFQPGIIGDARGAPILISGIVGGPISATVTVVIAAFTRWMVGGIGAPSGVSYVIIFGVISVFWGWFCRKNKQNPFDFIQIVALTTVSTFITMPLIFTFPAHIQYAVLVGVWPQLWIANLIGVWILSTLMGKERERRVAEARLIRERHRADQASLAKAKFLAAMSHEIRTPLNGILGIIQLTLKEQLPQKIESDLKLARESGFFLLGLLNQILDFAKIEAGKTEIVEEEFRIGVLVDGLSSIFAFQMSTKNLKFLTKIYSDKSRCYRGDFEHIRQVLFNLLGNSAKFTEKGYVKLLVEEENVEGQTWLNFRVIDTGPGIPEEDIDKVFEEFQQSTIDGESRAGSGLGLSIVDGLVHDMGGTISIKSRVGDGTEISVRIPVSIVAASDMREPSSAQSVERLTNAYSILVAEDNTVNQLVVRGMLETQGHNVNIVSTGREAVEMITAMPNSFDLVLMDIQMPVLNGIEATRKIREMPQVRDDLPIVALTANAFTEQKESYLEAGMTDVLTKPINEVDLIIVLTRLLKNVKPVLVEEKQQAMHTFEKQKLEEMCQMLGVDVVRDLLSKSQERVQIIMKGLEGSLDKPDDVEVYSHELRGMISNFGFLKSAEVSKQMQLNTKNTDEVTRLYQELEIWITSDFKEADDIIRHYEAEVSAFQFSQP